MPETTLAADKRDIFRVGKTEPACLHSHYFLWFLGLSCVAPSPTLFFDFPKPFRFETLSLRGRSEKVNSWHVQQTETEKVHVLVWRKCLMRDEWELPVSSCLDMKATPSLFTLWHPRLDLTSSVGDETVRIFQWRVDRQNAYLLKLATK